MVYDKFLVDEFSIIAVYNQVKNLFSQEKIFLFESVINNSDGNYSFIFIGEKERVVYKDEKTYYFNGKEEEVLEEDAFSFLKRYYSNIKKEYYVNLTKQLKIGFVDGFVGYVSYDIIKVFEPVLKEYMDNLQDDLNIPDLYMIRPKIVIGFSHKSSEMTIIINDETYKEYLYILKDIINSTYKHIPLKKAIIKSEKFYLDKEKFFELVDISKEHIKNGDIFQILISNRLVVEAKVDRLSFYRKLRSKNPSPYLFYLDIDDFAIIGSSPEIMVRLNNGSILLRPIAGTRKRGDNLKKDLELEEDLINDEKERAEHLMLVDLGRNDVGRVAIAGSVKVPDLMRVERYSHVMHMVSDVIGEIDSRYDMFDLFKATFTAGTMTGAPKIKAMELIAKLEGLKRGFYSGSVGYFGFDGNMDSAIAIRTAYVDNEKIVFQAGAGIVADSKKELEYKEINNKLKALVETLKDLANGRN